MSNLTFDEIQKLIEKHGGDLAVRKFLAEETVAAPVPRSVPAYPDWVEKVLYPELESTDPAEFDAGTLEQWLHEGQKNGCTTGNTIHEYLADHDMIKDCLGLQGLEAIQKKGITFFRKHFNGKAVFGWKSVVRDRDGDFRVPGLYQGDGGVVYLDWGWLDCDWDVLHPALLRPS